MRRYIKLFRSFMKTKYVLEVIWLILRFIMDAESVPNLE